MNLDSNNPKPIYVQIADWIENEILDGAFGVDDKVYSQYQLAEMFNINPATAAKGINLLSDEDILYTRRGLGKFVNERAKERILDKRKSKTLTGIIEKLIRESRILNVSEVELIDMIKQANLLLKEEKK